ncbi:ABC transporter permease [Streptomyces sp. BE20]|uniref:ABC transporter permease n=1 Tax=unclassified Streptomyces TaxID=2593676 RepID=UPI002E776399|nr:MULTISPECIES: ABC transporter permease [unclassified Streptomyces]MED7952587.1 ABC transporter permease [Streptomyces sp. BE303]MEE1823698.1 ABC transporter permease [Streptomyces sp. BE20]
MSSHTTLSPPTSQARPTSRPRDVDNRASYVSFGLAYLLGHGTAAVSEGEDPLVDLPGWLPVMLLGSGLAVGVVSATAAAVRAQRGAPAPDVLAGRLLGAAWIAAFTALALAVTGLTSALDTPELPDVLWPTGSGFVVGLLYLAEGAVRRNVLHYALGVWLALVSTAALSLHTPGLYWVLTLAGGGAYAFAAVLEHRRLACPGGSALG